MMIYSQLYNILIPGMFVGMAFIVLGYLISLVIETAKAEKKAQEHDKIDGV